jgi:urease subunit gamma
MQLSPHEQERLPLSYPAEVARRRRGRGPLPNHLEAVLDGIELPARDGAR